MPEEVPPTIQHALALALRGLDDRASLVCVLDPDGGLGLGESFAAGRTEWLVRHYSGNDLSFRAEQTSGRPCLIWITAAEPLSSAEPDRLDLSSLADILTQADAILDLSVAGVLGRLTPGETWPNSSLRRYAGLFGKHLAEVVDEYKRLRRALPSGSALDAAALRALALHCLRPELSSEELLLRLDTAHAVLRGYLSLAWRLAWDEESEQLLREQAQDALHAHGVTESAWCVPSLAELARYIYLYSFLSRVKVPEAAGHLRSLGLLPFDPRSLEEEAGTALLLWDKGVDWRRNVIHQAESSLTAADVKSLVDALGKSKDVLLRALHACEAPAVVAEVCARLILSTVREEQRRQMLLAWPGERPSRLDELPKTPFNGHALALIGFFDGLSQVEVALAQDPPKFVDLANALDWYVGSGSCRLELAHARAVSACRLLARADLQHALQKYLDESKRRMQEFLDAADRALATVIGRDLSAYLSSPRLATNVLRDCILAKGNAPSAKAAVWIVVLDGMRWDTWQEIVKPRLLQTFELKQEKAYFCVLPSCTRVARTALLAGRSPSYWLGYRNTFTAQQDVLLAKALGLAEGEHARRLRFVSRMDSDRTARQIDPSCRFSVNSIIFNVSDDNLHSQSGNLDVVNRVVEELLPEIVGTLQGLVQPEDLVVISSDHGFAELREGHSVMIRDDSRWQRFMEGGKHPVNYRYLAGVDPPAGLTDTLLLNHKGMPDGQFTVAVGGRWFQRQNVTGPTARYAHGGLSFAEMVVPGAVLQRITERRVEVSFVQVPHELEVREGQELQCEVTIGNTGNQSAHFLLAYRTDSEQQDHEVNGVLEPSEIRRITIQASVRYREQAGTTKGLRLQLSFGSTPSDLRPAIPREIPVSVVPQRGKVELSLGAFDDIDT